MFQLNAMPVFRQSRPRTYTTGPKYAMVVQIGHVCHMWIAGPCRPIRRMSAQGAGAASRSGRSPRPDSVPPERRQGRPH
jgi:hypothetical protein